MTTTEASLLTPTVISAVVAAAGGVSIKLISVVAAHYRNKGKSKDEERAQDAVIERAEQVEALETAAGIRIEMKRHIKDLTDQSRRLNEELENWRLKYYETLGKMVTLEADHKILKAKYDTLELDNQRLMAKLEALDG